MHIHYFQHDHFEDLGFIGDWATTRNFTTTVSRFDLEPYYPDHNEYDWLVVLGGKMGVNDSDDYPWINDEIAFIKQAITKRKIVIGICLGAQLVASALGAKVYRNTEPEMGFRPIQMNAHAANDAIFRHFPAELNVMHMHFDIFEVPVGAVSMAKSMVTPCQAFRFGENVFALQFHFEISESNAQNFIREVTPEIVPGKYVQYPPEMLLNTHNCPINNRIFSKMLDSISDHSTNLK
jgi:GMP synthase-like glutamine amidotransferase